MARNGFDYDWLIVGSGFGGSVSALRLAEKGYSVGVLECGRRYPRRGLTPERPGVCAVPVGAPRSGCAGSFD